MGHIFFERITFTLMSISIHSQDTFESMETSHSWTGPFATIVYVHRIKFLVEISQLLRNRISHKNLNISETMGSHPMLTHRLSRR